MSDRMRVHEKRTMYIQAHTHLNGMQIDWILPGDPTRAVVNHVFDKVLRHSFRVHIVNAAK